ncbi:hypothetical protein T4B_15315 [Trichinella pseudospiralis]|uniref:Uncharacterized protein n=1 Tax=Trichinella pseudospiralis TaxID=6337 RepID=A0A0V1DYJ1_TRIPS|nr:hypothetical protein T4A_5153 [Trichinella pseudospiralis]KRY66337.1 hypothetical protein T4A_787 [Trichinella pseudospiralis]KRY66348.1 hypothetical protein T4A_13283 [Trichinella pseudospiralis]KRZ06732.1 hypothetical protein T4B_8557 [Trichinella pseudospiralis]KRZ20221.1 hypothetical protein T4B_15315 [Trichinella pseudospiralis]
MSFLDLSTSLEQASEIAEPMLSQTNFLIKRLLSVHFNAFIFFILALAAVINCYHYCYDVEPHIQKQLCTKSADSQHT